MAIERVAKSQGYKAPSKNPIDGFHKADKGMRVEARQDTEPHVMWECAANPNSAPVSQVWPCAKVPSSAFMIKLPGVRYLRGDMAWEGHQSARGLSLMSRISTVVITSCHHMPRDGMRMGEEALYGNLTYLCCRRLGVCIVCHLIPWLQGVSALQGMRVFCRTVLPR